MLTLTFALLSPKADFRVFFFAFYGQRSVTAAWATRSPWSIFSPFFAFDPLGESPVCENLFSPKKYAENKYFFFNEKKLIFLLLRLLLFTHFWESPVRENLFPPIFWYN